MILALIYFSLIRPLWRRLKFRIFLTESQAAELRKRDAERLELMASLARGKNLNREVYDYLILESLNYHVVEPAGVFGIFILWEKPPTDDREEVEVLNLIRE